MKQTIQTGLSQQLQIRDSAATRHALLTFVILAMTVAAGCGPENIGREMSPSDLKREMAVFETVASIEYDDISEAYATLELMSYRLQTVTTERDESGRIIAAETRTYAMTPQGGRLEEKSADGNLSEGFMTFATSTDSISDQSRKLAELWAPLKPAFSSPRNREYYRYSRVADSTVGDETADVYQIWAVDDAPTEKIPIRDARLVVARSDSSILAIQLRRRDDALVYGEQSMVKIFLKRDAGGRIVPVRRSVDVTIRPPLRKAHRFTTTQEYLYDSADIDGR